MSGKASRISKLLNAATNSALGNGPTTGATNLKDGASSSGFVAPKLASSTALHFSISASGAMGKVLVASSASSSMKKPAGTEWADAGAEEAGAAAVSTASTDATRGATRATRAAAAVRAAMRGVALLGVARCAPGKRAARAARAAEACVEQAMWRGRVGTGGAARGASVTCARSHNRRVWPRRGTSAGSSSRAMPLRRQPPASPARCQEQPRTAKRASAPRNRHYVAAPAGDGAQWK